MPSFTLPQRRHIPAWSSLHLCVKFLCTAVMPAVLTLVGVKLLSHLVSMTGCQCNWCYLRPAAIGRAENHLLQWLCDITNVWARYKVCTLGQTPL